MVYIVCGDVRAYATPIKNARTRRAFQTWQAKNYLAAAAGFASAFLAAAASAFSFLAAAAFSFFAALAAAFSSLVILAFAAGLASALASAFAAGAAIAAGAATAAAGLEAAAIGAPTCEAANAPTANRPEIRAARILFIWKFPGITLLEKVPRKFRRPNRNGAGLQSVDTPLQLFFTELL